MRPGHTALSALTVLALGGTALAARPVVIEESTVITTPDAAAWPDFGYEVATNGEYAVIAGFRAEYSGDEIWHYGALLYRRVNGAWTYQLPLQTYDHYYDSYSFPVNFAMKGDLAAIALAGSPRMYRRNASGWQAAGGALALTEDLELENDRVLAGIGEFYWNGQIAEWNGTGWNSTFLQGQPRGNDDEFWGGPVGLGGNYAILGTPYTYDLEPQEIPVYQRDSGGNWLLLDKLQVPYGAGRLRGGVAINSGDAIVHAQGGSYAWRLPGGTYSPVGRLQALDSTLMGNAWLYSDPDIEADGRYVLVRETSNDTGLFVLKVFQRDANGEYQHVAVLRPKNGQSIGDSFDIAGNTVVAEGPDRVFVFELPAGGLTPPPERRAEDFETGNGAGWTPTAGSQFAVVQTTIPGGTTRVYRQSAATGDARAVLANTTWRDQAIEADIKPTAFTGSDRWVGLATRYADAQNHYYVTLRSSGTVQLRRMRNGTFTTLASAALPVTLNRTYRVRLQSIGTHHRVYVDGRPVLEAHDAATGPAGNAALMMYAARADYDNVVVSPSPRTTMFANDFNVQYFEGPWQTTGTGQWSQGSNNTVFAQSSVAGDARAFIGTPADDQVVEVRVRPNAYAAPSGTQERWTGVMARYRNDTNYYYLSLRSGNTVSLRKLVNGAITTIASAPLNVSLGQWYSLRLEAIGTQLRGYVNGTLVVRATDSSHASGASGPVTFKAAADFDDFAAYQP